MRDMNYDVFSADASNQARSANNNTVSIMKANVTLLQMGNDIVASLREMRSWETDRFNNLVDGFHKVYAKLDEQNQQIQNLQEQVAGLQKKLYEQEQRSKEAAEKCPPIE